MNTTALNYFKDHPEEADSVMKAFFAYHVEDHGNHLGAHYFLSSVKTSKCHWCGRTRQQVRWDDGPPECQMRPIEFPDIAHTLSSEEAAYNKLLDRAASDVPKVVSKRGMSGETLAFLHHTLGYDPEVVSGIVPVPDHLITEYNLSMGAERERSRSAIVREVISCAY